MGQGRYAAVNVRRLLILTFTLVWLAACTALPVEPTIPAPVLPTTTPQTLDTATPAPTATATLSPTLTPSPTVTPYPLAFPLGEIAYRIPPTIRYLTSDSVTIFFELDQPAQGMLMLIDETGMLAQEQTWDTTATRHLLTVEGFTPGATYHVLPVLTSEEQWTQPAFLGKPWPLAVTFPSGKTPLRIGVISDASFGDAVTQQFVNEMAAANLDFVLHPGDVVDETEWDIDPYVSYAEKFYTPFAPLLQQMPVYTVPGNHDYDADIRYNDEPFYFTAFPPAPPMADRQFYALDYAGMRFLLLDSQTLWGMSGRVEQDAWLAEQLQDTQTTTIAVFHIAPFSSSSVHPEDSAPLRNFWVPQFESANVPLVLSGHFHHYERLLVNDIHYIVAGSGSAVTYALGQYLPESQFVRRVSSYVLLEIDEETIYLQAIDIDGNVIDTLTVGR
jgi:predicted phosphodiesterase